MIRQTNAKKETGLDDVLRDYTPQPLEEQQKVIMTGSATSALQKVCQTYDQHIDSFPYMDPSERMPFIRQIGYRPLSTQFKHQGMMKRHDRTLKLKDDPCYKIRLDDILTPTEINTFVQYKIEQDPRSHAGLFLSKLIQNSYYAGFNNFQIRLTTLEGVISCVSYLEGTLEKPLVIDVHGTIKDFAYNLSHVQATLYGKARDVGSRVSRSSITVFGDVQENLCSKSLDSTFIFHGKIMKDEGMQKKIYSSDSGYSPANCTFKTSDQETLEKIRRNIPGRRSDPLKLGNKIIFLHPNGTEETVRDFDDA